MTDADLEKELRPLAQVLLKDANALLASNPPPSVRRFANRVIYATEKYLHETEHYDAPR